MEEDSNKENFNKFHLKELEINKRNWSNILLGNQFLKLYFLKNGISNSLVVDRLIKLDHLKIKKSNEKFKFAIVRSRENTKNLGEDGEKNEDEKVEDKRTTYSRIEYENYENVFDQKKFLFFVNIFKYFYYMNKNILFTYNGLNFHYIVKNSCSLILKLIKR